MPGHEFLVMGGDQRHRAYDKITPSGIGMRVATKEMDHPDQNNEVIEALQKYLAREGWRPIPEAGRFLTRPLRGAARQEYEYCWFYLEYIPSPARYLAYQLTPDELVFIDKDESVDDLKARLVSDGWEPIDGESDLLKRPLGA